MHRVVAVATVGSVTSLYIVKWTMTTEMIFAIWTGDPPNTICSYKCWVHASYHVHFPIKGLDAQTSRSSVKWSILVVGSRTMQLQFNTMRVFFNPVFIQP